VLEAARAIENNNIDAPMTALLGLAGDRLIRCKDKNDSASAPAGAGAIKHSLPLRSRLYAVV
jgi:hypothetical protein